MGTSKECNRRIGPLIPPRMAAIVKIKGGLTKTRLIHDLWMSGVKSLAAIPEQIVLSRLVDAVHGVFDIFRAVNLVKASTQRSWILPTLSSRSQYTCLNRGTCHSVLTSREWRDGLFIRLSCSEPLLVLLLWWRPFVVGASCSTAEVSVSGCHAPQQDCTPMLRR